MTTTLILAGEVIVAAADDVTFDTESAAYVSAEGVFPLSANVTGTVTVDDLPADFAPHRYVWRDGALVRLPDPPAPPAPVPASVTNFQARAALIAAGLFDAVDAAVRASTDPVAVQAWDYANEITRDGALVNGLAAGLGLTEAQLDDLFRAAAGISA